MQWRERWWGMPTRLRAGTLWVNRTHVAYARTRILKRPARPAGGRVYGLVPSTAAADRICAPTDGLAPGSGTPEHYG